jgi:hypothetical protein
MDEASIVEQDIAGVSFERNEARKSKALGTDLLRRETQFVSSWSDIEATIGLGRVIQIIIDIKNEGRKLRISGITIGVYRDLATIAREFKDQSFSSTEEIVAEEVMD